MIAKQSVYLNADRTAAVHEGHADAKFLLVREGGEVEEALVEKYDGALDLVNSEAKAQAEPAPSPREAMPPPVGSAPEKAAPVKGKKKGGRPAKSKK